MSLAFDILDRANRGVSLTFHGDTLILQDDGGTPILGQLDVAPELMPSFLLDADPREVASFDVPGSNPVGVFGGVTRQINQNDLFLQTFTDGSQVMWKVIRYEGNPADIAFRFWLQQLEIGLDPNAATN